MAERYLTGAIQKYEPGAKLAEASARLIQKGCGIPIEPPSGRRRLSVIKEPFPLKLGTEKNGGLAIEVAEEKYHWALTGLETVMNLSRDLREKVTIVRHIPDLAPCQYRLGVSALAFGVDTLEKLEELIQGGLRIPQTLDELKPGIRIATKHVNLMEEIFRQRGLNLKAIYDPTPETAPELRNILYAADNFETGRSWRAHEITPGENLLDPHGVLIKAKRLPWGIGQIFYKEFLPRFNQALAHPETWLNPVIPSDAGNIGGDPENPKNQGGSHGIVGIIRGIFPMGRNAAMLSLSSMFTLFCSSAILNSWDLRTSKKKDLKS